VHVALREPLAHIRAAPHISAVLLALGIPT
jgi:hypothetical protein